MINHIRTLLLNRTAVDAGPQSTYLWEYVQPTFSPIKLTPDLEAIRDLIVSKGLLQPQINRNLLALMPLLHRSEFLPYTLAFDTRTTYPITVDTVNYTPLTETSSISPLCDITFSYRILKSLYQLPPGLYFYGIAKDPVSANTVVVTYRNGTVKVPIVFNNHKATVVLIPNYLEATLESPTDTIGGTFNYLLEFSMYKPFDIAALYQKLFMAVINTKLFITPNKDMTAAFTAFNTCWASNPEDIMRFGAAYLALAYHCESKR